MIPKMLMPKFNAKICTMCDRGINQHRDDASYQKYLETGYCQSCIDLECSDLPNQGTASIDWQKCVMQLLKQIDELHNDKDSVYSAEDVLHGSDIPVGDCVEIWSEYVKGV